MRHRIQFLKFTILAVAAGLTAFLFLWTEDENTRVVIETPELNTVTLNKRTEAETEMLSPRFLGEDGEHRRWEVTAERAVQSNKGEVETVSLENLLAKVTMDDSQTISFSAGSGQLNHAQSTLILGDDVVLNGMGYVMRTKTLTANVTTKVATSAGQVTIDAFGASVVGGQLSLLDDAKTINLTKGVKAKMKTASAAPVFVTADALTYHQKSNSAVFKGHVKVKHKQDNQDTALGADQLKVTYKNALGVEKVEADGHVTVVTAENTATADKAIFDPKTNLVTLMGRVKMTRAGSLLTGDKLIYNPKTGTMKMDAVKQGAQSNDPSDEQSHEQGGRVKASFTFGNSDESSDNKAVTSPEVKK